MTREDKKNPVGNDSDIDVANQDKADILQSKQRDVNQRITKELDIDKDEPGIPHKKFNNFTAGF